MKAIWLIDDEELYLVEPVVEIKANEDIKSINVYNGYYWYSTDDCEYATGRCPNKFMLVME